MTDDDEFDLSSELTIRVSVTAFDSTDKPVPNDIESTPLETTRDYTPSDGGVNNKWSDYEVRDIESSELAECVTTFAADISEAGITDTSPPAVRVFESGIAVVVNNITILSRDIEAGIELRFEADPLERVARLENGFHIDKHQVGSQNEGEIDEVWDTIGRELHNEFEWLIFRLPDIKDMKELYSDEELANK